MRVFSVLQENDSNKIEATEKGSVEYDNEKEAADSGEKDSDSNNLSNHSSPNKPAKSVSEINEKEELKLSLDASNEKDSDKQSDNEENSKQSIKPYVSSLWLFTYSNHSADSSNICRFDALFQKSRGTALECIRKHAIIQRFHIKCFRSHSSESTL